MSRAKRRPHPCSRFKTPRTTKACRIRVNDKIGLLRREGYPRRQATAIALNMERRGKLRGGQAARAARPVTCQTDRVAQLGTAIIQGLGLALGGFLAGHAIEKGREVAEFSGVMPRRRRRLPPGW